MVIKRISRKTEESKKGSSAIKQPIYWVFSKSTCHADIPGLKPDWVRSSEWAESRHFSPRRLQEWLQSRWVTKQFLASIPGQEGSALSDWSIVKEESGQPYAEFKGDIKGWLSLSHREGAVFCAWSPDPTRRFGVDLEWIEPRSSEFIQDYLTIAEREIVSSTDPTRQGLLTTMIWSGKEAMLKALSLGLTVDTLKVETLPDIGSVDLNQWTYSKGTSKIKEVMDWTIQFRTSGQYIQTIAVLNNQNIGFVEVNPSNRDYTGTDQD